MSWLEAGRDLITNNTRTIMSAIPTTAQDIFPANP